MLPKVSATKRAPFKHQVPPLSVSAHLAVVYGFLVLFKAQNLCSILLFQESSRVFLRFSNIPGFSKVLLVLPSFRHLICLKFYWFVTSFSNFLLVLSNFSGFLLVFLIFSYVYSSFMTACLRFSRNTMLAGLAVRCQVCSETSTSLAHWTTSSRPIQS